MVLGQSHFVLFVLFGGMTFPAHFRSLKEALADWVHADVATYYFACCLGLMGPEDGSLDGFRDAKHVFSGSDKLGASLWKFMDELVALSVLEFDDKAIKYRWSPSFRGSWPA
jgi:hypothetical protein